MPVAASTARAKAIGIGDRRIARDAAGEPGGAVEVGALHQAVDALVDVAEPLFEPHDRLAIGGEAEMPGLDDAGMHRPDRDLVQALALDREEGYAAAGASPAPGSLAVAERMADAPAAVIEPGPRVGGAFGPRARRDRRSPAPAGSPAVARADRGEASVGAVEAQHRDVVAIEECHVHRLRLAP